MMNKRGVTLIEATICVLVGSIVMLAASKMLSSGMRTSTKGAALLTNVQNVSILMAQIEEDVQRAFNVSFGPSGIPENSLKMEIFFEDRSGGMATCTIIYEQAADGLGIERKRILDKGGSAEMHPFCKGLEILNCQFTKLELADDRLGYRVSIKVATRPNHNEEFRIDRFIPCRNHASNSFALGWQEQ